MEPRHVRAMIAYNPARFVPQILHRDERTKAVLVCLAPGQSIPAHREDHQGFFYALEGHGFVQTDAGERALSEGDLVVIPRGATRGLRPGEGNFAVLAVAVLGEG